MSRPLLFRILAWSCAATAGLAAPVGALAHGHAHHDGAVEHEHHDLAASSHHDEPGAAVGGTPAGDTHRHGHARLDDALSTRGQSLVPALLAPRVAPAILREVGRAVAPVLRHEERKSDLAHAPPPPSRAPPSPLG